MAKELGLSAVRYFWQELSPRHNGYSVSSVAGKREGRDEGGLGGSHGISGRVERSSTNSP